MKRIAKFFILNLIFTLSLTAQDEEFGIASYYSDLFHGKPTASGELYDKTKLTAAHKSLPFGTLVKVTRLDNNKSVQVRVNDRGPFISGRIIELSREAASRVDLLTDGSARVKVEIVQEKSGDDAQVSSPAAKPKAYGNDDKKITEKKEPATQPKEADKATAARVNKSPEKEAPPASKDETPAKTTSSHSVLVKSQDYQPYDLFEIQLKRPEKKGFGVQVAALTSQDALFRKIADLQGHWFENILVSVEKADNDQVMYKVILGSFIEKSEASEYRKNLKKNKKIDGFVVDLSALTNQ